MIDLRSDTVTKPGSAMREAMARAEVGDDVFSEDPTVNLLQEKVADLLGKESGLFVASGTMANEVSLFTHTRRGDEVILEAGSHIYQYEAGAPAVLSGVQLCMIEGRHGIITAEKVEARVRPDNVHNPVTSLIWIENTHNRAGGTIFPLEEIRQIRETADRYELAMHLDGARLWNAHVASGVPLRELTRYFDSVSVCFSKGLGAPVGSMIAGSDEFIQRARRTRKIFGGGMRQAGILAAAALYALEHNIDRLTEDHRHARILAEAINKLPGMSVDMETVQTNIIYFDIDLKRMTTAEVQQSLEKQGVHVLTVGPARLRAVTHLDVSEKDIHEAVRIFNRLFKKRG